MKFNTENQNLELSMNTKAGLSLNIPAKKTCPQATDACKAVCYADRGRMVAGMNGGAAAERNYRAIQRMLETTGRLDMHVPYGMPIRLMGAGDLFSVAFARACFDLCRRHKANLFWLYTRSIKILEEVLEEVPQNLVILVSVDRDNHKTHLAFAKKHGLPVAYMGEDIPGAEFAFGCPAIEQKKRFPLTRKLGEQACLRCRFCFSPKVEKRRLAAGVRFKIH